MTTNVFPEVSLVSSLINNKENSIHIEKISLGCKYFDQLLNGGLLKKGITEICGESGCGKTQFVLRLLETCLMNVNNNDIKCKLPSGMSLYIYTEGTAPTKRLEEIIKHHIHHSPIHPVEFLDRILIREVHSAEDLINVLNVEVLRLFYAFQHNSNLQIRLIVIDSIAGVFRGDSDFTYSAKDLVKRNRLLEKLTSTIHFINEKFGCYFVIVNQVSAGMEGSIPALGLHWSNSINSRIILSRYFQKNKQQSPPVKKYLNNEETEQDSHENYQSNILENRTFYIQFSPIYPNICIHFTIDLDGINAIHT